MPPKLTAADYRALAEFRFEIRRFLGFSERAARVSGLEPRQHQLLLAVKGLPEDAEPTIGELARRLQVEHHSAVEMVDRLEERRLVTRLRDERDRRRVLVRLTAKGEALLRDLSLSHRQELRGAAPALVASLGALVGAGARQARAATTAANGRARRQTGQTRNERSRKRRQ
jgi:DNA-binding MarR family transcriptional regulator